MLGLQNSEDYSTFRNAYLFVAFDSSTWSCGFRLFTNCSFVKFDDITIPLVDFRRVFARDMFLQLT
jgi:hypothetical protein